MQVLILKEACDVSIRAADADSTKLALSTAANVHTMTDSVLCTSIPDAQKLCFTWRIDNFLSFKEILETRKIFSKFFAIGGCELRIGVYAPLPWKV